MSKNELTTKPAIPAETRDLLGEAPVLATEDPNQYEAMLVRFAQGVKTPRDIFEWFWLKDAVDARWEIQRCRLFKRGLIALAKEAKLNQTIDRIRSECKAKLDAEKPFRLFDLPAGRLHGDRRSLWEVDEAAWLKESDVEEEQKRKAENEKLEAAVQKELERLRARMDSDDGAGAFEMCIESYEQADRLEAAAQKRFNAAVEQLDRHRQGLGLRLQQISDEIVDGEFNEVPSEFPRTLAESPTAAVASVPSPAATPVAPAHPLDQVEAAAEPAVAQQTDAVSPQVSGVAPNDPTAQAVAIPPAAPENEQASEQLVQVPPAETMVAITESEAAAAASKPTEIEPVQST
jgi:hypothetical protein